MEKECITSVSDCLVLFFNLAYGRVQFLLFLPRQWMYWPWINAELLDIGVEAGIIDKSGSWYSYDGERIGQGRENAKEFLKANPDICDAVSAKLSNVLGLSGNERPS